MKKTNLLLALVASTVLVGCESNTTLKDGSDAIGNAGDAETILDLQKFYETLKASNGGTAAMEVLIDRLAELEYAEGIKNGFPETVKDSNNSDVFNVKVYRTQEKFNSQINEFFQDIVDGTTYNDEDGKFDANKYKDYVEGLDYNLELGTSTLITDSKLNATLAYNYDEYIKDVVIPDIYEQYVYEDYVLASNKYKGQFANQYAFTFEVLKIDNYTTAQNSAWTEALIKDVKAVSVQDNAKEGYKFNSNNYAKYSFVTSNSDNELIVFTAENNGLTYTVYADNESKTINSLLNKVYNREVKEITPASAEVTAAIADATKVSSWTVNAATKFDSEFFAHVEELLIARKLYNIDQEVIMARNYDFKNDEYNAYIESDKTQAKTYADTYSSNGAKSIKEGAKSSKITAQRTEYYHESDTYTKNDYSNVLPSAITSLRGTTAKDLITNLINFNGESYLLPNKDSLTSPVYLDSEFYYVCKVTDWYGYYKTSGDVYEKYAPYKSIPNYQIDAYQKGKYNEWVPVKNAEGEVTSFTEEKDETGKIKDYKTCENESIIDLCQTSVKSILTTSMKTEAIVQLLEKYSLEINDQDIYDYIKSQYPDYFG